MATSRMRRQRAKAKFPWPVVFAVAIVVAVGGGLAYKLKGTEKRENLFSAGNTTSDTEKGAKVPKTAVNEDELAKRLEGASRYAEEHPYEFDAVLDSLRRIEKKGAGTKYARQAAEKIEELERAKNAAVKKALDDLQSQAEKLSKDGRYPEALKAVDLMVGFPKELKPFLDQEQLSEVKAALLGQANIRLELLTTRADQLASGGKVDEAVELLETAKTWGLEGIQKKVDQKVKELKSREAEFRDKAEQKTAKLYRGAFALVLPLLKERKYDEALASCDGLLESLHYDSIEDCIQKGKADIEKAKSVHDAAISELPNRVGKPFSIKGIPGTLKQVRDGKIYLAAREAVIAQPVSALSTEQLANLAASAMEKLGGEGDLRLGVFWFFEGETDRAMKALEEAEAAGADVPCCKKRMAYLQSAPKPATQ